VFHDKVRDLVKARHFTGRRVAESFLYDRMGDASCYHEDNGGVSRRGPTRANHGVGSPAESAYFGERAVVSGLSTRAKIYVGSLRRMPVLSYKMTKRYVRRV
jgi:hypothetical protein